MQVSIRTMRGRGSKYLVAGVVLLCILIAPSSILGILIGFLYAAIITTRTSKQMLPLVFSLTLFLSALNVTKSLESDLIVYFSISNDLNGISFFEALSAYAHEPGYYLVNWFVVNKLNFEWRHWVFLFTFLLYFIWLYAIDRLMRFLDVNHYLRISIIIISAFSPLVFSQSAHLVRQYLSGGIAFFGVVEFLKTGRGWRYFILAPLVHLASGVFLFIPVSHMLFKGVSKRYYFILILLFALFSFQIIQSSVFYDLVNSIAGGWPEIISYGLSRLTQEQFFDNDKLGLIPLTLTVIILASSLFGLFASSLDKLNNKLVDSSRLSALLTFNAVLSLGVLLFSYIGHTEPALRAFQFMLIQSPLLIALYVKFFKYVKVLLYAASFLMPLIFCFYPTKWTYSHFGEVLILPYYYYLY